jgi:hypothetical protein
MMSDAIQCRRARREWTVARLECRRARTACFQLCCPVAILLSACTGFAEGFGYQKPKQTGVNAE